MKANLIVLKTQESQEDFYTIIEPTLTRKLAQNGVDISKTIVFKQFDELNKNLFGLLESCSIILLDLSIPSTDFLFTQIDQFYATKSTDFSQGKQWNDNATNRHCLVFDMNNPEFVYQLDNSFLKQTFAPTKYLTLIKTYGLDESEIRRVIRSVPNQCNFEWYITSNFLDCEISVLVEGDYYKSNELQEYIRTIYELLGDYIYSDNDDSLFQKLEELLSVRNAKLAIADSLTNGQFNNLMLKHLQNYNEKIAVFYNITEQNDYINTLKMSSQFLSKYDINSVEVIYEMAASLLENSPASLALVLTGTSEKPYIALGDSEAIHLYKFNFNHAHSFINNIMIQTSVFKLIKKLKKNDRLF